jgi:RND family efflux transporter MFP subunit
MQTITRSAVALAFLGAALPAAATEFDCLVEARRVINIGAPLEALIAVVRVDRGDLVRKGDVLVEFDSGVEKATVDLARLRAEMKSAVDARKARSDYATVKHERRSALVSQNFVSKQDLDEAEAERRLSEAELREAQDNRRIAEVEHRRAAEALRQRTLLSPVNGVVVERLMHAGEVSELGRKPILKIAEIGTLNVEAVLPSEAYRHVAKGDTATVRLESAIGGSYPAKVVVVDRMLDAASATFGVRLELANGERGVPAGVRCKVDLPKVAVKPRARNGTAAAAPPDNR